MNTVPILLRVLRSTPAISVAHGGRSPSESRTGACVRPCTFLQVKRSAGMTARQIGLHVHGSTSWQNSVTCLFRRLTYRLAASVAAAAAVAATAVVVGMPLSRNSRTCCVVAASWAGLVSVATHKPMPSASCRRRAKHAVALSTPGSSITPALHGTEGTAFEKPHQHAVETGCCQPLFSPNVLASSRAEPETSFVGAHRRSRTLPATADAEDDSRPDRSPRWVPLVRRAFVAEDVPSR
ncbi:hypothetical protein F4778DRAFT_712981 [Xylariomycetidae sp. FL2044]|nr:hypothetical protein F4778DRAFT_712981 [Xylariomycetidae sp. FL2044]